MILMYAVENQKEKKFLLTKKEKAEKKLQQYKRHKFVTTEIGTIKDLLNQDIIEIEGKRILNNTNLSIDIDYDEYNKYYYYFEQKYYVGDFEITFYIKGTRIEGEPIDFEEFLIEIEKGNKLIKINIENKTIDNLYLNEIIEKEAQEILELMEIIEIEMKELLENFEEFVPIENIVEKSEITCFDKIKKIYYLYKKLN